MKETECFAFTYIFDNNLDKKPDTGIKKGFVAYLKYPRYFTASVVKLMVD